MVSFIALLHALFSAALNSGSAGGGVGSGVGSGAGSVLGAVSARGWRHLGLHHRGISRRRRCRWRCRGSIVHIRWWHRFVSRHRCWTWHRRSIRRLRVFGHKAIHQIRLRDRFTIEPSNSRQSTSLCRRHLFSRFSRFRLLPFDIALFFFWLA